MAKVFFETHPMCPGLLLKWGISSFKNWLQRKMRKILKCLEDDCHFFKAFYLRVKQDFHCCPLDSIQFVSWCPELSWVPPRSLCPRCWKGMVRGPLQPLLLPGPGVQPEMHKWCMTSNSTNGNARIWVDHPNRYQTHLPGLFHILSWRVCIDLVIFILIISY